MPGRKTGPRTRTSLSDDGNERCFAFDRCEPKVREANSAETRGRAWLHPQPIRFAALRVNQERTLTSRTIFKDRRAAALAEWRQLCTA
jgi:hypothetical protein